MDWDLGRYEHVAAQLLPAAAHVVDRSAPAPGEHVVDLGCGTGNAALIVAGRGARVTGIDPSSRLLAVARRAALDRGLGANFIVGEAGRLPLPDGSVDAVVSVFGVIFAAGATAAAAEMARVLAPRGRIVLSAWLPVGPMAEQARLRREAVEAALGAAPGPAPFAWHDGDRLSALLAPHGLSVELHHEVLAFTGPSPREYAESEWQNHPLWVEARTVLEQRGMWRSVSGAALRVLVDANEESSAFRVSSHYVVAVASRDASSPPAA